uniref:C2 domain-containing protein n=1 Tax=Timema douglasi TaxID=61478 RepID=A0A7R8VKA8_TIMDO|nr:unnamed protein product [Timema douglasi]
MARIIHSRLARLRFEFWHRELESDVPTTRLSLQEETKYKCWSVLLQYFQRNTKLCDVNRRLKSQIWSSVVTIVLVEGKNLLPMDIDGFSDPYAKFRLGNEKYKSKVIYKTLNPSWLEQFDLHLYDDQSQDLEVTIWDKDRSKDDFMGRYRQIYICYYHLFL